MAQAKPARWGQERRLEFIDFRLYWDGRVNRSDLINFFGVSVPQASLDLAKYQELAPHNTVYDRTEKAYVASDAFSPAIASSEANAYLNQVLGVQLGILQPNSTFYGWPPPVDAVKDPSRNVVPSTLRIVLQAIRAHRKVNIVYQSMSRPLPVPRTISPHAIAFDGARWHVRAFSYEHDAYRDFVFARILEIDLGDISQVDASTDTAWHRELEAIIMPHPASSEAQRRAIELDYGMNDGQLVLKIREALLLYLLKHLAVLDEPGESAAASPIVLANRKALSPFFADHGFPTEELVKPSRVKHE
jgi:hypothetical protein